MQMTIVQETYLTADEQRDLAMHEQRIETALDQMLAAGVIVGVNLREINRKRLYRSYGTFEQYVAERWQKGRQWAYQLIGAARVLDNIGLDVSNCVQIPTESQLRPLTKLPAEEQPIAWDEANARTDGKPTARVVEEVVKEMRAPAPREEWQPDPQNVFTDPKAEQAEIVREETKARINAGMFTSATPEWYTPGHIIERVEAVFGHIDLDPCSNSREAPNVPALNHWTVDDNGIAQPWHGKVYMNPPYGDEIATWVGRMLGAYEIGEIYEAIALLPARTDTAWFQPLFGFPICFVKGRLKFSGSENSAPFPSAVVYVGKDVQLFRDWFASLGPIVRALDAAA